MRRFTRAALVAATLALAAAPAAHASITPPPTDFVDPGIHNGCEHAQGDPCDIVITGPDPSVDKTYPSRLVAWAESVLP